MVIGGANTTTNLTIGQATVSQTTNIQAGATSTGNTKIINFGDERYLVYLKSGIVNADEELIKLFSKYFTTKYKSYSFCYYSKCTCFETRIHT